MFILEEYSHMGVTKGYLILNLGCYFIVVVLIFLREGFMEPRLALNSWSSCLPFPPKGWSHRCAHHKRWILGFNILIWNDINIQTIAEGYVN